MKKLILSEFRIVITNISLAAMPLIKSASKQTITASYIYINAAYAKQTVQRAYFGRTAWKFRS